MWFEFVGLVVGTKVGHCEAKLASSHDMRGLVAVNSQNDFQLVAEIA